MWEIRKMGGFDKVDFYKMVTPLDTGSLGHSRGETVIFDLLL